MARTRLYRNGTLAAEDFPADEVADRLAEPDTLVWVNMSSPDEDDLATIARQLNLHRLAVEDAVHEHQRPKLDRYDSHLFMTAYAVRVHADTDLLTAGEVAAFMTPRALVTVTKDDGFEVERLVSRWDSTADGAASGIGYLVYGLLDYIVDSHVDAAQELSEKTEALEDAVFEERGGYTDIQRRSLRLHRSIALLRRVVQPMGDIVNAMIRLDFEGADARLRPYFQDIRDHVLRTAELTDSLRDLLANIRETQLTLQGNRLNEIMKKVTSWAAIIAIPTAITGFYGQNLPYPGFAQPWGFWFSSAVIVAASSALYLLFKRRDWL
ncbi:MAG TPA: magnesium transporter CorA family protein [Stackebrandtia sp.]|uniref:magnesium transporter CorA family protein n=1 Tax=Stackebrandtia sp. TaxID=2023065 RepID=UPI002D3B777D|nr:magnesium transporter CorA family protein [Stackebrandtia sp.]HZE38184.1 magnesium transporter CorA family protein [Stackebrandtia sp.]